MTETTCGVERHADTYVDSVLLLAATRAMSDTEGITWATALMATPAKPGGAPSREDARRRTSPAPSATTSS